MDWEPELKIWNYYFVILQSYATRSFYEYFTVKKRDRKRKTRRKFEELIAGDLNLTDLLGWLLRYIQKYTHPTSPFLHYYTALCEELLWSFQGFSLPYSQLVDIIYTFPRSILASNVIFLWSSEGDEVFRVLVTIRPSDESLVKEEEKEGKGDRKQSDKCILLNNVVLLKGKFNVECTN